MRSLGIIGIAALVVIGAAGCTAQPTAAPAAESEPVSAPEPTPTEPSEPEVEPQKDSYRFGETVTVDVDGSMWEVTLKEPIDVTDQMGDFPANDGMIYVGIPGTVTRTEGGPQKPLRDFSVDAVIDNRTVSTDGPYSGSAPESLWDAGEMYSGAVAGFTEIFEVPAGTTIETASVAFGMGEAGGRYIFGEPVDLGDAVDHGEQEPAEDSPSVVLMQQAWGAADKESRNVSREAWGLLDGDVSDDDAQQLVNEAGLEGVPFTLSEARVFLEWALTQ